MNRQEYQEKLLCIKTDNVGLKLMEGIKIRNQYIDSLESDVEQLKAENAQLKSDNLYLLKQVEINGKALDLACAIAANGCPESYQICKYPGGSLGKANEVGCVQCWKEYYLKKAGEK